MIIDTNKELTDDVSPGPIGGPVPRMSLAPKGADYQGILECPCTTRKPKILDNYDAINSGKCSPKTTVDTVAECSHAAHVAGASGAAVEYGDPTAPYGCSAVPNSTGAWSIRFNNVSTSTASCGASNGAIVGTSTGGAVRVTVSVAGGVVTIALSAATNGNWFGVGLNASSMAGNPWSLVVDGAGNVSEHQLGLRASASFSFRFPRLHGVISPALTR